jgi:diguanylate cyclase (GGDEF)-like protein
MKLIRDQILEYLDACAGQDQKLIDIIDRLAEEKSSKVYTVIFHILTNLDLAPEKARGYWGEIVKHRNRLISTVGRDISLITAICDYFCSINKTLSNPKVIEIHLFEQTAHSSRHDNLTGLLNRHTFDDIFGKEISRARRQQTHLSVMFLDLDNFKNVNDTYGHQAGDVVLKRVSEIIQSEKRNEDIIFRYGGEEILLLLPHTEKVSALILGERIRKKIKDLVVFYEEKQISVTISGGIAAYPTDATNKKDLIKFADNALYRAKGFGKNNVTLYAINKRLHPRFECETAVAVRKLDRIDSPHLTSVTKSLSVGGMLFESNIPLEIGAKIQLNIQVKDDNQILLLGSVVRVQPQESSKYDIGISFLGVDKATRGQIAQYLEDELGKDYLEREA